MTTLRQRQINEVLDEDRNINRQVVNNTKKQVKVFNDIGQPITVNQAVSLDDFLNQVDLFIDTLVVDIADIDEEVVGNLQPDFSRYNKILRLRQDILRKNVQAKSVVNAKMQTILPYLNSVVIGMSEIVNSVIYDYHLDEDPLTKNVDKRDNILLTRMMTNYSAFSLMRNNISNENYNPVDYNEVDHEFNKIVKGYDLNVRKNVAIGSMSSAATGYRRGDNVSLANEVKRMEAELERKLTQQEEMLLSIRVGGFKQYKPILTPKEMEAFNEKAPNPLPYERPPNQVEDLEDAVLQQANEQNAVENEINQNDDDDNLVDFDEPPQQNDDENLRLIPAEPERGPPREIQYRRSQQSASNIPENPRTQMNFRDERNDLSNIMKNLNQP